MIAVAVASAFFAGVVMGWVVRSFMTPRSPLQPRERKLLDRAMSLLWKIQNPTNVDRLDMLSDQSQKEVNNLLKEYEKEVK